MSDIRDSQVYTLCEADQAVLDELVESRFEAAFVPSADEPRTKAMVELLGVLDHSPAPEPDDALVAKTLQRVADARDSMTVSSNEMRPAGVLGTGFSWMEITTVAAVLLVGIAILLPVLKQARLNARITVCQSSLGELAIGFTSYADDYSGALPSLEANPGTPWWNIGRSRPGEPVQSNSAHLLVLARSGYAEVGSLNCSGNEHVVDSLPADAIDWPNAKSVGLSYQNQYALRKSQWDSGQTIAVLADKNPVFSPGRFFRGLPLSVNSNNHGGDGQNVLTTAGVADWQPTPVLEQQDNIWHRARGKTDYEYKGMELPQDEGDSFLVP